MAPREILYDQSMQKFKQNVKQMELQEKNYDKIENIKSILSENYIKIVKYNSSLDTEV